MRRQIAFLSAIITMGVTMPAYAQDDRPAPAAPEDPISVTSRASIEIDGKDVRYTTHVREFILHNDMDEPTASIFTNTHSKDEVIQMEVFMNSIALHHSVAFDIRMVSIGPGRLARLLALSKHSSISK